jgi:hypothetical protein
MNGNSELGAKLLLRGPDVVATGDQTAAKISDSEAAIRMPLPENARIT